MRQLDAIEGQPPALFDCPKDPETSYILYTKAGRGLNRYLRGEEEECFEGIDQIGRSGSGDEKGNRLEPARLESGRKTDTFFDHKHQNPFVQYTYRYLILPKVKSTCI